MGKSKRRPAPEDRRVRDPKPETVGRGGHRNLVREALEELWEEDEDFNNLLKDVFDETD